MAGEFYVLYGLPQGGYKKPLVFENSGGGPLEITPESNFALLDIICTRPYAVDLNDDGNLDIVSGNKTGSFALFWSDASGQFSSSTMLTDSEGAVLKASGHSDPTFVDWDGDGDYDMLSGAIMGGVFYYENIGNRKSPIFSKAAALVEPRHETDVVLYEANLTAPQMATRAVAADVNRDGKLDLLVGETGNIWSPAEGVSESECLVQLDEWKTAWRELETQGFSSDGDRQKAWRDFVAKRYRFMKADRTGNVWLYLGK